MGKSCIEVNLEYGHPRLEDALDELRNALKTAKQNKTGCIVFVHGYGSSGAGGIIRVKARQILDSRQKKGEIKTVINGEDFNIFNPQAIELKHKYKELEQYMRVVNHGITIAEL